MATSQKIRIKLKAYDHEAIDQARKIIQSVDSYHKISVYPVGRPVPITLNSDYAAITTKVDLKNKVVSTISEDVKAKREKEKAEMEEMKRREKQLLDEAKPDYQPDPYEEYTTLRVKKAQLVWTYNRTMEQLEKVKTSIIKTREDIAEMLGISTDEVVELEGNSMKKMRHPARSQHLRPFLDEA